jgi:uncharacterized protein (TIGR00661 family)
MRFLFIVQTEGRGHLSQALTLADILEAEHHEIVTVLIGRSKRTVPSYFLDRFGDKIQYFDSPNFAYDQRHEGLNLPKTFLSNALKIPKFLKSIAFVRKQIQAHDVDIVINFYEFIGALAHFGLRRKHKHIVLSHHFYLTGPDHELVQGRRLETFLLKSLNGLMARKADKVWALSFREGEARKNVIVMPPLISQEMLEAKATRGDYILAYSVNKGYAEQLKSWQQRNPEVVIHYFWDGKQDIACEEVQKNLFFHKLNRELFLEYLMHCNGYVSTAGFESVCEAICLGKPILLIPVNQQLEQANNAKDALKTGNCMQETSFELDNFMTFIEKDFTNESFRTWAKSAPKLFLEQLGL